MLEKFTTGKVAVFIDAANLSKSIEIAGFKVNYRKLRRYFQKECNLVYIGFYTVAFSKKARLLQRAVNTVLRLHYYPIKTNVKSQIQIRFKFVFSNFEKKVIEEEWEYNIPDFPLLV